MNQCEDDQTHLNEANDGARQPPTRISAGRGGAFPGKRPAQLDALNAMMESLVALLEEWAPIPTSQQKYSIDSAQNLPDWVRNLLEHDISSHSDSILMDGGIDQWIHQRIRILSREVGIKVRCIEADLARWLELNASRYAYAEYGILLLLCMETALIDGSLRLSPRLASYCRRRLDVLGSSSKQDTVTVRRMDVRRYPGSRTSGRPSRVRKVWPRQET